MKKLATTIMTIITSSVMTVVILGVVAVATSSNKTNNSAPAQIASPIPAATPTQQINAAAQAVIDAPAPTPEPEVCKAIAVTAAEKQAQKDLARIDALANEGADFSDISPLSDSEDEGLKFTISSTGKRHNSTGRYYGKGRSASRKQGVACKICGG